MKKIAGNETLDVYRYGAGETHEARLLCHARQMQDDRAKLVFEFLRSWGYAAAFADVMGDLMDHAHANDEKPAKQDNPKPKPPSPQDLAMRACEIVDAAWSELRHRGWIMETPGLDS